jgi:hypothetical protein
MPEPAKTLPFPPHWINSYLFDKLGEYDPLEVGITPNQTIVPFFAPMPTGREELYDQLKSNSGLSQPTMITYDRLIRFRSGPFYPVKKEQLVYTVYGSVQSVQNINIIISQLLDREDAAAQDINDWAKNNPIMLNGDAVDLNVFFHGIRVYQVDESRDLVELSSVNMGDFVSKIIIEYDYHAQNDTTFK